MEEGEAVKGLESPATMALVQSRLSSIHTSFFQNHTSWASVICEQKAPEQYNQEARRRIEKAYCHRRGC